MCPQTDLVTAMTEACEKHSSETQVSCISMVLGEDGKPEYKLHSTNKTVPFDADGGGGAMHECKVWLMETGWPFFGR